MVDSAFASIQEVDLILLMVEISHPEAPEALTIIAKLKGINKPCMLAINKIDIFPREKLLPIIDHLRQLYPFEAIIPISALTGDGVNGLFHELKSRLNPGPMFYPEGMKSDQTEPFMISEIIREKVYLHTRQEIPYSSAVTVNKMEEIAEKGLLSIAARIHVETESQKKVVIGKAGRMIKAIGKSAREELERIFGVRVYLDLFVRVEKNWSRDTKALRRLGY
jgi:GTP-binding protein Era